MKTLDKLMMTIVGLLCFCVSAAALIFMDFSTEHGVVYADALYCIPVCVLLLAFAVLTILKFRTGYDGNLKLAGIVWDVLFVLAFLPILGVPAITQTSGAYGLLCKVLFVLVLLAGVLMISGSMNSNLAQRTQFFGMMRCIGMSKRQVIRFVRLEALNWCRTAVPIGLVLGTLASWTICAAPSPPCRTPRNRD